jgi:hypothetical protein
MSDIVLGVDPGWQSFGVALNVNGGNVYANNFVPSEYETPYNFLIDGLFPTLEKDVGFKVALIEHMFIERFVAYAGIHSDASEKILMMIGAICYAMQERCYSCDTRMVRAIDWKQRLCKYLVRTQGFDNPYPSFDKKFSILAAQTISGNKSIATNHEADAICLSYLREVEIYERDHRKAKATT